MRTNRTIYSVLAFTIAIAAVAAPAGAQAITLRVSALSLNVPQQGGADELYNQGVDLQGARKYDEAIKKYDEAIKKRAVFPDAWLNRGICYLALSKWDPAIENFNLYITRKPEIAIGYINRASAYTGKKMFTEALKDYDTAIAKKPKADELVPLYLNRGNAFFNMGDFDKAVADYTQVISAGGKVDPVVYLNRGNAYMNKAAKAGDNAAAAKPSFDAATKDFTEYIRLAPTDAEGYLARAESNLNAKSYAPVIEDVTKYYSMNGTDAAGYAFRAQAYLAMTPPKMVEASADIEKAIAKEPNNAAYPGLFIQLANARLKAGDNKGAIDVATKLLTIPSQSKNMNALKIRALAYTNLADPTSTANAIKDYDVIIAANPKDAPSIQNRAVGYFRLKQFDKAAADADLWAAAEPASVEPYNLKGLALLSATPPKYAEAAVVYTKVIEKKPADSAARYNRGLAYYNLKQWDKAIPDLEEAAKDSKLPQAKDLPGMIATAYSNVPGGAAKAIERLKAQVATKPTDGEAHYNLAALMFQEASKMPEGDGKKQAFSATLPYYTKATELLKGDPDPYVGRASVYFKLGQWDNAIKDATSALAVSPKNVNASALFIRADSNFNKANANKADKAAMTAAATAASADYTTIAALPGLTPAQYDDAAEGKGLADALVGNYKGAIATNTAILAKKPNDPVALRGRAIAYYNDKQYDLAIKDFDAFIKVKADDAQAYYVRGLSYKAKGDGASALKDYEKSFSLKADFAVGNAAGELYLAEGDKFYKADPSDPDKAFDMYDKAAAMFDKAAASGAASGTPAKTIADAYFNKGLALSKKGDMTEFKTQATPAGPIYKEAIAAYEKYLQQTPPPADAPKVQEQITRLKEKAG